MNKKRIVKKDIREKLINELKTILKKHGFIPLKNNVEGFHGGYEFLLERDHEWKQDLLRLYYPETLDYVDISYGINYPVEEKTLCLAFCNIKWHLHKKSESYYIPKMFYDLRKKSFYNSILNDVKKSIDWFEDYSNAKKALKKIVEDARKEDMVGSKVHKWAKEYLENLLKNE